MIPFEIKVPTVDNNIPRASGDDPCVAPGAALATQYSPRERG